MTAKLEDNLDSLSSSEVKRLLERICKSLGFTLYNNLFIGWLLSVDDDTAVFLDDHNRDKFSSIRGLLKGILNSRIFKLRSVKSWDEKLIQNPFYSLDLPALQIKLDLLLV